MYGDFEDHFDGVDDRVAEDFGFLEADGVGDADALDGFGEGGSVDGCGEFVGVEGFFGGFVLFELFADASAVGEVEVDEAVDKALDDADAWALAAAALVVRNR